MNSSDVFSLGSANDKSELMKKLLFIIPILLIFLVPVFAFAETGCLVPGYTELLINQSGVSGPYFNLPNLPAPQGCQWVLISRISGCIGHGRGGVKGVYELQCPIDDYVPILLFITIGTVLLKKKLPT